MRLIALKVVINWVENVQNYQKLENCQKTENCLS